tara:strand:+ start:515 stop:694 length:180 start_codon:yes stop_codon:yes gene_type:complete
MKIIVQVKDQYGRQVIHPICKNARLFAELAGTKTLTSAALKTIKSLGYQIELDQLELNF